MTRKEKLRLDHPDWSEKQFRLIFRDSCPGEYGFYEELSECLGNCAECWDREIHEKNEQSSKLIYAHIGDSIAKVERVDISEDGLEATLKPIIKDSGNRRQFESGAVRDMQEGKGRCDLMPLEVVAAWLKDDIISCIAQFKTQGTTVFLYGALNYFLDASGWSYYDALLEVAKHFEEGAKKYGENNWQKGIPPKCYIDSAVRHYLKWLRCDKDEPHDRAFVWNLMCCIWEVDYREKEEA